MFNYGAASPTSQALAIYDDAPKDKRKTVVENEEGSRRYEEERDAMLRQVRKAAIGVEELTEEVFQAQMDYFENELKILQVWEEEEKANPAIPWEKLESDDPYHLKKHEETQAVFKRHVEEDTRRIEAKNSSYNSSYSNVEILNPGGKDKVKPSFASKVETSTQPAGASATTSTNTNSNTSATSTPVKDETPHLFQRFANATTAMQNAAISSNGKLTETKEEGWAKYAKKTWWQKAKEFVKSKNFALGAKIAAMLGLNMGMAIVGKKYQIDSVGEGLTFIGCMLGVFFLTRELHKDGVDARQLGF